jgi:hypothetical protein
VSTALNLLGMMSEICVAIWRNLRNLWTMAKKESKMTDEEKYAYWVTHACYDMDTAGAMLASGRWVYVVYVPAGA